MMECPESVRPGARSCAIRVRKELVQELRERLGGEEGRRQAYRFVPPEFQARADAAYIAMGAPKIALTNVWEIFDAMRAALR